MSRLQIVARLIMAAAVACILAIVLWALVMGGERLEIPPIIIWIAVGAAAVNLLLWISRSVMRRS
jgi:hypothetical protein